ncbi:MAG: protein phosphatase CheZ [Gammaproteobacteria bacterium]|nr:protein phosphatase CheZ [Gammaproteobacteria bacterium]
MTVSINEETLTRAQALVASIEAGDGDTATELLEELSRQSESELFNELGRLTRELHDALSGFQIDSSIKQLTESDIPDAKERLNHVIGLTEEAADKTLTAVETALPLTEDLEKKAAEFKTKWQRFRNKDMDVEDFREMSRGLDSFLDQIGPKTTSIHGHLSDILMAQGFQDLTGQIIRRVITLVKDVEDNLVDLIRISGQRIKPIVDAADEINLGPADVANNDKKDNKKEEESVGAFGPHVPGVDNVSEIVSGQDDVDDLLSSLGF